MLIQMKVDDFLAELASNSPAPGGGSISALAGSLGGALASMVCRLTIGNDKYAQVQSELETILVETDELSGALARCVDEDTEAFNKVMAAYKLPKATDEEKQTRSEAIQLAMANATELPLEVASSCLKVLSIAVRVLTIGNSNAASDAAVAGLMAHAGLHGALYNVKINLGSIKDQQFPKQIRAQMEFIVAEDQRLHDELVLAASKVIA